MILLIRFAVAAAGRNVFIMNIFTPAGVGVTLFHVAKEKHFCRFRGRRIYFIILNCPCRGGRIILLSRKRTIPRKRFRGSERKAKIPQLRCPKFYSAPKGAVKF